MIMEVILGLMGVVLFALILCMILDSNRFVVREYYFCTSRLGTSAKLVLLADLHNKTYGKNNRALLAAIERESPDYILVAGDMLTATKGKSFKPALGLLTALAEKYPIYYGNGNHESRLSLCPEQYQNMWEEYEKGLSGLSLEYLRNRHVSLPEGNVEIYGLELDRRYYKRFSKNQMTIDYLHEVLGKPDKEKVNLLIAHNPEYFREYAEWGADLVVSGHVHGGIMRLPFLGGGISPKLQLFPEFDGGVYHHVKSVMMLSRGLGSHTIPIRLFNPGELVVIHLRH